MIEDVERNITTNHARGSVSWSWAAKPAWLILLAVSVLLSSCVSGNLMQARQMLAEKRFDEACYWYDEALAELVPSNRLILERLGAYKAACKFHLSSARQLLLEGKLAEAAVEARAARRCAIEAKKLAGEARKTLGACADAYARRAGSNPLKTESNFTQGISDLEKALELVPDSEKVQQYAGSLDNVRTQFAAWLKDQGRLLEATRLLAKVQRKPPTSPAVTSPETPPKAVEQVEEEIKQRQRNAKDRLMEAEKLFQQGKWEEAVSSFREAGEMDQTLVWRAKDGQKRALAGQAREKMQVAVDARDWPEAQKWLKQWKDNNGGDEAVEMAGFVKGGEKSDRLLAQANEGVRRGLLNGAEDLLDQAMKFTAFDLKVAGAVDTAIKQRKSDALKAADRAKELALQARLARAKLEVERGEGIWSDWRGWTEVKKFIDDENTRGNTLAAAQEAFQRGEYKKALGKYQEALLVRFDKETADMLKTAREWLSSNELLVKAGAQMENKNLGPAIALAAKAVELRPGDGKARALLEEAKQLRAEVDKTLAQARDSCQRKDWREAVKLLEQCISKDVSCAEAPEMLRQATESLENEWGIRYSPHAAPAHVLLRHWFVWLLILAMMIAMIVLRKTAYVRFALSGSRQLDLREGLLKEKWWRITRIAGSIVFLAVLLVIVISWIVCESRVAGLAGDAADFESSGRLLEAREAHQSILESHPYTHYAPAARLAIFSISEKLPEDERIPVQNHQTGLQNWFEGSRRAVSPYSIDYAPILVAVLSLAILAFLIAFRLKKRLVPRFLLCVASIPAVMVLIIELLSTQSIGTGTIALPVSVFSRYIPYIAANASLVAAAALCFVGTDSPAAFMRFMARRRKDRSDATREVRKPIIVTKEKKDVLKEKLPGLPASEPQAESSPETEDEASAVRRTAATEPLRDSGPREPDAPKEDIPAPADEIRHEERPEEFVSPGKPPVENGEVMAADDYVKLLGDADPEVRIRAAGALGELDDARALEPLVEALGDPDEGVREAAAQALEKVGKSDLDLLKIAHKKEKDQTRKQKLNEIITSVVKRRD